MVDSYLTNLLGFSLVVWRPVPKFQLLEFVIWSVTIAGFVFSIPGASLSRMPFALPFS